MKITKKQLVKMVKEEMVQPVAESMLLESPMPGQNNPDNEVFIDIIDHHSMVLKSKMSSIVTSVYKELENQGLDRDSEQDLLRDAAGELNNMTASNPIANMILEKLNFLAGPAVLLKEMAGASDVFSEGQLKEGKYKVGDSVVHDSDDLGRGKVVAVHSGKKGNIVVKWESGTKTHHRWALKPAKDKK